jgi:peptide deformylase
MARLEILEFPDERLRTVAKPVELFDGELSQLVDDMFQTMYEASGIGLAAVISEEHGTRVCEEGCLSVPGIYANVKRADRVKVQARKPDGDAFEEDLEGMHAVCLQHEMDHLAGKLFVDYLSPLKRRMVRKKLTKQRRHGGPSQAAGSRA